MMETSNQACLTAATPKTEYPGGIKWLAALIGVALLLALGPAQAQEPDDLYLRILTLIEQAESYNTNSQAGLALAKFQKARIELQNFQKTFPTWNVKVVSYRSKYLAERVATLSAPPAPPAESDPATAKPETRRDAKTVGAAGTMQVKLLDAGAEPRQVLRLHPKPGDKQTLGMTMKMAMETKIGEMETPAMKLPAMTLTMDVTVKSVSADGDIIYEMVMGEGSVAEEADVLPQIAELMKSSLASIKGLSGTGTTSSRGFNKGTDIKAPAGADPQTQQAMDQMKDSFSQATLPLPEEAVGPGAKWEVKMPLKSQGMTINQTVTYQLVSVDGGRLTAKSTIAQSAANQKIQNPAMPSLKLDLTKMTGRGTGDFTLDLAQLLPRTGTVESHSEMAMAMNAGGQKQTMTMKMNLHLRLEAK